MLVNFCTSQFQPILECSQMQLDGYHAQNLAKDFSQKYLFDKYSNSMKEKKTIDLIILNSN
jgi:hypothetical protein